jgi:hypothetical protein
VSAKIEGGKMNPVKVKSLKGADCLVHGDWQVRDFAGNVVNADRDEFGRLRFRTVPGGEYSLHASF